MRLVTMTLLTAMVNFIGLGCPAAAWDEASLRPLISAVEVAAPAALARHGTPGAAIAMVIEGEPVWTGGFGLASVASGAPVTADLAFEIASVTKPITTWALLKLAEEKRIDLDAPIETYLGGWKLPPSAHDHSKVTARRILAHAAGLSTGGDSGVEPGERVPTLVEAANGMTMDYGAIEVSYAPGEVYHYSSKGFVLLEMAVENITGEPFANYATREILGPLGMQQSAFGWTAELERKAAWGHDWYGNPLPHYQHATNAQGGIVATAGDVAKFLAASMCDGKGAQPCLGLISAASVQTTFTPYPYEADTSTVGLGYNLHVDSDVLVARKSGDHRGYKSIVFLVPEIGAGLVILTNSDRAAPGVFADIVCPWSRAMAGDPMRKVCGQLYTIRNAHWAAAGVAGLAGLAIAWIPVRDLRRGTRTMSLKLSSARWLLATLLVATLVAWWVFWFSDIPLRTQGFPPTFYTVRATLWPTAIVWVSWGVSVLIAAVLLNVVTPKAMEN
jgi:CubicO group peptidase (beta-lactamase class C family)